MTKKNIDKALIIKTVRGFLDEITPQLDEEETSTFMLTTIETTLKMVYISNGAQQTRRFLNDVKKGITHEQ